MKMRLTKPSAAQGAWLIAGRSAAGAVLLALAVSACTGGGSSVPSVFTPTPPTSGQGILGGPPGHSRPVAGGRGHVHQDAGRGHVGLRARAHDADGAREHVGLPARVGPGVIEAARDDCSVRFSVRRFVLRPGDAHLRSGGPGVPHDGTGDRRRWHGGPTGRHAVRRRRPGCPRRPRQPRLPQAPGPQTGRQRPGPPRPGRPGVSRPLASPRKSPNPHLHHGPLELFPR